MKEKTKKQMKKTQEKGITLIAFAISTKCLRYV